MEIEKLVRLRNVLQAVDGQLVIEYLQDLASDYACSEFDEKQLKGFCRAIAVLKRIPSEVEKKYRS